MLMRFFFDPLNKDCKNMIGAVKQRAAFTFNIFCLKTPKEIQENDYPIKTPSKEECAMPTADAYLHIYKEGDEAHTIPLLKTEYGWTLSIAIHEIGLYFYHFSIENTGNISCGYLEVGHLTEHIEDFLLTVYSEEYTTPDWFKGGVMYQVFPDRFHKSGTMPDIKGRIARNDWGGQPSYRPNAQGKVLNNDFFGGNLKGIQEKLPYLHDLGVTILYLNPIFEAASNHRYDTSNYIEIDPILGNKEDFQELVNAAKTYGIRIILDGVFNHTGDDSVYFNKYGNYNSLGAYQSKDSPYYSWYSFQDFPNKYSSWWGIDILPEVNENSLEYQEFIFAQGGVLKTWLEYGIGGYRLDVADELPDFFLKKLRKSVKESNSDAIIIGEVWEDASNKIAYSQRRAYLQGYELDSVMNYPLKDAIIYYLQSGKAHNLLQAVRVLINHYPKQTVDCLMNILGTHDTARILTVLGGIYCHNKDEMACPEKAFLTAENKQIAIEKLKMAATLQFTLPGVPCIYYGDENGTEGHIDPFCRTCFDWTHLNQDLIDFYTKLGEIRKKYQNIFKDGEFQEVLLENGLIVYKRLKNEEEIYIYCNNSQKSYALELHGNYTELLNDNLVENKLKIKPNAFGILKKN